jgi:hypothetical protein
MVQNKNIKGAKCKIHRNIGKNFKISRGASAPSHIHTARPLSQKSHIMGCPIGISLYVSKLAKI